MSGEGNASNDEGRIVFRESKWMFGDRPFKPIEKISLETREKLERRYKREPNETHADLVDKGYWMIAAQLRIDHQVGRL